MTLKRNDILLVVDMLNDFVQPEGALPVPFASKMVPEIKSLIDAAHKNGVRVVHVCDSHSENDSEFKTFPKHCVKGTQGAQIVSKLTPIIGDVVIEKNTLSAWESADFLRFVCDWEYANEAGKDARDPEVFIVGVATEYCVKAAAVGTFSGLEGGTPILITDCIAGVNTSNANTALMDMGLQCVEWDMSENVIRTWMNAPCATVPAPEDLVV